MDEGLVVCMVRIMCRLQGGSRAGAAASDG